VTEAPYSVFEHLGGALKIAGTRKPNEPIPQILSLQ
jgi:hypothetical protein